MACWNFCPPKPGSTVITSTMSTWPPSTCATRATPPPIGHNRRGDLALAQAVVPQLHHAAGCWGRPTLELGHLLQQP
eukprot:4429623-Pyramimonas_sp.AAC.1